jgi:hypothetical protein
VARVRLRLEEAREGDLPAVCMRCGSQATLAKDKTFSWHPQWISTLLVIGLLCFSPLILVALILMLTLSKRARVRAPLCEQHQHHWLWRSWFVYGGLLVFALLGIVAFFAVTAAESQSTLARDYGSFLCFGLFIAGIVWLIAAGIVQSKAIRASEITDYTITLIKVAPGFVAALEQELELDRTDTCADEDHAHARRRRPMDDSEQFTEQEHLRPPHHPPKTDSEQFYDPGEKPEREG